MKCWLVCLVVPCVAWGWAPAMARADDQPPPASTPTLRDLFWPHEPDPNCSNLGERDPFTAGQCDVQVMAGKYQKSGFGPGGPAFDYYTIGVRFGCMLTSPELDGCCLRGNVEALLEAQYGAVTREFGHYTAGP